MLRGHAAARCAMSAVVREALFRDIIGFIPVYTGVFTFGLWFGYSQLEWSWLQSLWWALPLTALVADYGEDLCHLRCLRLHQKGKCPSIAHALVGSVMTCVKLIGFFGEGALTLAIVTAATIQIYQAPVGYGWRGLVVLAISIVAGLILGGLTVGSIVYRKITGTARKHVHVSSRFARRSADGEHWRLTLPSRQASQSKPVGSDGQYRVHEFAELAGVTVKTLHHYDRVGLLRPRRTPSGYRVYTRSDLVRLEQILALKTIGFSLNDIRGLLDRETLPLPVIFRQQRHVLEKKRRLLDRAIRALTDAERAAAADSTPATVILQHVISVMNMQDIESMRKVLQRRGLGAVAALLR